MIIEFNEHDYSSVKRALKRIVRIKNNLVEADQSLKLDNKVSKKGSSFEKTFKSINTLYNSNSSQLNILYGINENVGDHYVYAHCNPNVNINISRSPKDLFAAQIGLTHKPFYVGKGVDDRCYVLNRNEGHRKIRSKLLNEGQDISVIKLIEGISESEAFLLESKLIDIFGLVSLDDQSWLINLDEGKYKDQRRQLYDSGSGRILRKNKLTA